MKKVLLGIALLTSVSTFASTTIVLTGMSLESSALAIQDFEAEGLSARRLNPTECARSSYDRGNLCVVATSADKTFVLYGLSPAGAAVVSEDFSSEGLKAKTLSPSECSNGSTIIGSYCVIAEGK